jgi:hypothetical protein
VALGGGEGFPTTLGHYRVRRQPGVVEQLPGLRNDHSSGPLRGAAPVRLPPGQVDQRPQRPGRASTPQPSYSPVFFGRVLIELGLAVGLPADGSDASGGRNGPPSTEVKNRSSRFPGSPRRKSGRLLDPYGRPANVAGEQTSVPVAVAARGAPAPESPPSDRVPEVNSCAHMICR